MKLFIYTNGLFLIISLSFLFFVSCQEQSPVNKIIDTMISPQDSIYKLLRDERRLTTGGKENFCYTSHCVGLPCVMEHLGNSSIELYQISLRQLRCECFGYQIHLYKYASETDWQGFFTAFASKNCKWGNQLYVYPPNYSEKEFSECRGLYEQPKWVFSLPKMLTDDQIKTLQRELSASPFWKSDLSRTPTTSYLQVESIKQGKYQQLTNLDANLSLALSQVLKEIPLKDTILLEIIRTGKYKQEYCQH